MSQKFKTKPGVLRSSSKCNFSGIAGMKSDTMRTCIAVTTTDDDEIWNVFLDKQRKSNGQVEIQGIDESMLLKIIATFPYD